ncbi:hypothetical protein AAII07_56955 [Microvirga sp. 0TCS3.31]
MDFVDQFRRLARLLFKWALIAVIVVAGLTGATAAGLYGYEWWTYDRHRALVEVSATTDARCDEPQFPIMVRIANNSTKAIENTRLELVAKRPGRSSDVTKPYSSMENDHIIPPGRKLWICAMDEFVDDAKSEDPRKLEWSAYLVSVTFAD